MYLQCSCKELLTTSFQEQVINRQSSVGRFLRQLPCFLLVGLFFIQQEDRSCPVYADIFAFSAVGLPPRTKESGHFDFSYISPMREE